MSENQRSCVDCAMKGCDIAGGKRPQFCLTDSMPEDLRNEALEHYGDTEEGRILKAAAKVEHEGYMRWCRVRETMEFARRMGYRKIGIATCIGLISESRTLASILRSNGFEVFGISCKAGMVPKEDVGIGKECCDVGYYTCNPVLQAKMLNAQKTDLNILVGLCVGHDSLFYRNSEAPVTTLVAKDRVLAHNPVGALYTYGSYYKGLGGERSRSIRCPNNESTFKSDCPDQGMSGNLNREKDTVETMVRMYCAGMHGSTPPCPDCRGLLDYAMSRIDSCPFGEGKPRCDRCERHCYRGEMRDRMRSVMRYSGPRMIVRHPVMAIRHLLHREGITGIAPCYGSEIDPGEEQADRYDDRRPSHQADVLGFHAEWHTCIVFNVTLGQTPGGTDAWHPASRVSSH